MNKLNEVIKALRSLKHEESIGTRRSGERGGMSRKSGTRYGVFETRRTWKSARQIERGARRQEGPGLNRTIVELR